MRYILSFLLYYFSFIIILINLLLESLLFYQEFSLFCILFLLGIFFFSNFLFSFILDTARIFQVLIKFKCDY